MTQIWVKKNPALFSVTTISDTWNWKFN